jgi:hypothetical protein
MVGSGGLGDDTADASCAERVNITIGAWVGVATIAAGFGLVSPKRAGAILSLVALGLVVAWTMRLRWKSHTSAVTSAQRTARKIARSGRLKAN